MKRALGTAIALTAAACSTSYGPARSPRIAVVQSGGVPVLVRDGRSHAPGLFGGGLVDAVEGDAAATQHAESYQALLTGGFIGNLTGVACATGTLVLVAADRHPDPGAVTGTLLCAVAGLIVGASLVTAAQPYLWDAVNTYNDGVDARFGAPWRFAPAPAPGTPPPLLPAGGLLPLPPPAPAGSAPAPTPP
ncbi:MAG: hypothetical protein IT376_22130 [Polyangiaceae bacterium]|nr:hypothetical protein [Polyangiaceae bacterium]